MMALVNFGSSGKADIFLPKGVRTNLSSDLKGEMMIFYRYYRKNQLRCQLIVVHHKSPEGIKLGFIVPHANGCQVTTEIFSDQVPQNGLVPIHRGTIKCAIFS